MNSGIGIIGLIKVSNSSIFSPPLTFIAPISVIPAPTVGEAPVVSKSKTTKVTSRKSRSGRFAAGADRCSLAAMADTVRLTADERLFLCQVTIKNYVWR